MTKLLVLYYSSYSHLEAISNAVGARVARVTGATCPLKP
ncbi:MAG: NAD(P)H:quinone oxidoreductase, partial [Sphingopyxis sp.]|nr:NAD(P)H:quinone oxidoreductase [Sphingopyxis sp.]